MNLSEFVQHKQVAWFGLDMCIFMYMRILCVVSFAEFSILYLFNRPLSLDLQQLCELTLGSFLFNREMLWKLMGKKEEIFLCSFYNI